MISLSIVTAVGVLVACVSSEPVCTRANYRDVLLSYATSFNKQEWFSFRNAHASGSQLLVGAHTAPYLRNALSVTELECIAKQVQWSLDFAIDDAEFASSDATVATVTVRHSVTTSQLLQPVRMAFVAQERFTFSNDVNQKCRIVLHELAWSALNPDVLMLNALLDSCLSSSPP
jgi:hypothetical protein